MVVNLRDELKEQFGHAFPEALFPLFKSDNEYILIKNVLSERFGAGNKEIMYMYKYLASQHLPKFVIFSTKLPFGIVIKRLTPQKAWNEYFCNIIISKIHSIDLDVINHETLGCISEKYIPGFDVLNLPKDFINNKFILNRLFFWMGKCTSVSYVLGIADRGHNERLMSIEIEDLFPIYCLTKKSEPIINIDFEEFLNNRLFNEEIDTTEIAMGFYSILIQITSFLEFDFEKSFKSFKQGFLTKLKEISSLWKKDRNFISDNIKELLNLTLNVNYKKIISNINRKIKILPDEEFFQLIYNKIENQINKLKILEKHYTNSVSLKKKLKILKYQNP